MQTLYGINTVTSGYIDISKTLLGAKQYATRHGYNEVYKRPNCGYNVVLVASKDDVTGKWISAADIDGSTRSAWGY